MNESNTPGAPAVAPANLQFELRIGRLLAELHGEAVLSEQQCAKYMDLDIVTWRKLERCFSAGTSFIETNEPEELLAEDSESILRAARGYPGHSCKSDLAEFADEVKQLCEDFSGRDGSVYIKDVQATIDALLARFLAYAGAPAAGTAAPEQQKEPLVLGHKAAPSGQVPAAFTAPSMLANVPRAEGSAPSLWQIAKQSAADATRIFFMPMRHWEVWVAVVAAAVVLTLVTR